MIPCLDVRGGRLVKGINFESLRDCGDPVDAARRYAADGADEIVWLNIAAGEESWTSLLRGGRLDEIRRRGCDRTTTRCCSQIRRCTTTSPPKM